MMSHIARHVVAAHLSRRETLNAACPQEDPDYLSLFQEILQTRLVRRILKQDQAVLLLEEALEIAKVLGDLAPKGAQDMSPPSKEAFSTSVEPLRDEAYAQWREATEHSARVSGAIKRLQATHPSVSLNTLEHVFGVTRRSLQRWRSGLKTENVHALNLLRLAAKLPAEDFHEATACIRNVQIARRGQVRPPGRYIDLARVALHRTVMDL